MTLKELLCMTDPKLNVRVVFSKPYFGYTDSYGSLPNMIVNLREDANWQVTKISFETHDRHGFLVENGIMVVNVEVV